MRKQAFWIICIFVVLCMVVGIWFLINSKEEAKLQLPENTVVHYVYHDSDNPLVLSDLTLDTSNSQFRFSVSPLSSASPYTGEYELSQDKLVLKGPAMNIFTFHIKGNKFVFDAKDSSEVPTYKYYEDDKEVKYDSVPDGAVFEIKEENVNDTF